MRSTNRVSVKSLNIINTLLLALLCFCVFQITLHLPQNTEQTSETSISFNQLQEIADKVDTPLTDAITRFGYNTAIQLLYSFKQVDAEINYALYRLNKEKLQLISNTGVKHVEPELKQEQVTLNNTKVVFQPLKTDLKTEGLLILQYTNKVQPTVIAAVPSMMLYVWLTLAGLLFICCILLLPISFTKKIVHHTKQLEDEILTITEKNDYKLSVSTDIGLGLKTIATSINHLLSQVNRSEQLHIESEANLQSLQESLETQVSSRTKELERVIAVAEQANEAKTTFLATMSHEIRTPMNGVIGTIDLLRNTELDGAQFRLSSIIRESAFSLLGILDDILDFSKIEAGKLSIEHKPFSVIHVAEDVAKLMSSIAHKKDLNLSLYIDPEIPETLLGDTIRIRQVLYNLCSNAIKFTKSDEHQKGKVAIELRLKNKTHDYLTIEFKISDNGKGMDKQQLARIFQPFSQAEDSITREYGGTGLGLSICKSITELMYGQIKVTSEPGLGSEFTVSLPLTLCEESIADNKGRLNGFKVALYSEDDTNTEQLSSYLKFLGAQTFHFEQLNEGEPWQYSQGLIWLLDSAAGMDKVNTLIRRIAYDLEDQQQQAIVLGKLTDAKLNYDSVFYLSSQPLCKTNLFNSLLIAAGLNKPKGVKRKPQLAYESSASTRNEQPKILLVEDNLMNQQVITEQLNLLGYGVDVAEDGEQGFTMWQNNVYPLVLTDLHMPKVSGYDLAAKIRQAGPHRKDMLEQSVIIAITANALKGERDKCIAQGMNDYITKPVELNVLEEILNKWQPQQGQAPKANPIELTKLSSYIGHDPKKYHQYLTMFLEHGNSLIRDMKQSLKDEDLTKLSELAHQLQSTAKTIGANTLSNKANELEQTIEQQPHIESVQLTHYCDVLEQSFFEVQHYIYQFLENHKS